MKRPWILHALPHTVTFTGMCFGLVSLVWASRHHYAAAVAVLLACTCDLLDGRIARWTKTESAFGLQLDSLADVINCGVAPALLLHYWVLHGAMQGRFDLYLLLSFFLCCLRSWKACEIQY